MSGWQKLTGTRVCYQGEVARLVHADSFRIVLETEADTPERIAVSEHDWAGVTILDADSAVAARDEGDLRGALVAARTIRSGLPQTAPVGALIGQETGTRGTPLRPRPSSPPSLTPCLVHRAPPGPPKAGITNQAAGAGRRPSR